jgi:hypothetical protein
LFGEPVIGYLTGRLKGIEAEEVIKEIAKVD